MQITVENLSPQALREVLQVAFIKCELDEDGDIGIGGNCYVWVQPKKEQSLISLYAQLEFKRDVGEHERLRAVNAINNGYYLVKATTGTKHLLQFRYDITLAGGITSEALIVAVRRFAEVPLDAVKDHAVGLCED